MRIAIVGMGYVGLCTAAALAWVGHEVCGVEIDAKRLRQLRGGTAPFYEPGLTETLPAVRERLSFVGAIEEALPAEVVMTAVGTPSRDDGSADLRQLFQAVDALARRIRPGTDTLFVNKSTAPVGTLERLATRLPDGVPVACNPEFLRQSHALYDVLYPDRIVVGANSPSVAGRLRSLYEPIVQRSFSHPDGLDRPSTAGPPPLMVMDPRSAELAKYAANAFLAAKISFINEIANVCDKTGADVRYVASVLGTDPRIGPQFLGAGIGYGGSCFPKDTRALRQIAGESGYDFRLLRAVIEVNATQPVRVVDKLDQALGGLSGRRVAVLGLTFKPNTDDLRDAPSLAIVPALVRHGADVRAHDPVAIPRAASFLPDEVELCEDVDEALNGADALLLLTEWEAYRRLSAAALSGMRGRVIVDGRNTLDPCAFPGFQYVGMGCGRTAAADLAANEMVS